MQERGEGVIVNLSSIVGRHFAMSGTVAYGSSKAAIEALTHTVAKECIQLGIRINWTAPAPVGSPAHTNMTTRQKTTASWFRNGSFNS